MGRLENSSQGGVRFVGSVDTDADVAQAARLAAVCGAYRGDDEDEDPLYGAVNCFGCRFRRWAPDGFTCMKNLLAAQ
jgi:hypothetical protein